MIFTAVPGALCEYRWTLSRFHGHVWRRADAPSQWGATLHGFPTFGKGNTRRAAVRDAVFAAMRASGPVSHPSL